MSKPVTNEEVEDVLSSIRRLVSEDKRPLAGLRSAPSGPAAIPSGPQGEEKPDKLVLTPALRVAQTPPDAPAETQDDGPLDLGQVARQTWITQDEQQPSDERSAAESATDDEISDAPQDAHEDAEDVSFDELDALVQDTLAGEPLSTEDAGGNEDTDDNDATEADWHDVALMHGDETELDFDQPSEEDGDGNKGETADASDPESAQAPVEEAAEPVLAEQGAPLDETVPLTAKIAALETAIGAIRQDWEPDGAGNDDYSGSPAAAMAWEDDVDLDATGSPLADRTEQDRTQSQPRTDEPKADTAANLAADDALMDEEALRDLVSEIVRSELQGALGERITRNVRKLVRREIHRALTAQEME